MVGSAMTFSYDDGVDGDGKFGGIKRIIVDWTSDSATGAVSGTTRKIVGELIKGVTDPGASTADPTDNYDITVSDEKSVDVLSSCKKGLADRDMANNEEQYFMLLNNDTSALSMALRPVVCDKLTIAIAAAGNSKTGQLILYYR